MQTTGTADLHMHSSVGDGLHSVEEILEWVEHNTSLDLISITDHDDITASLRARELAARRRYRFGVVPGLEVSTRSGHLLVYGVERPIPALRSAEETAHTVAEQGGWCIAPHPMSRITMSLRGPQLDVLREAGVLLGVETLNSSPAGRLGRRQTHDYNLAHLDVAETGGSDSHRRELIGSAYTSFEGRTEQDFVRSLRARRTAAEGRFWTLSECTQGALRITCRAWFVLPAKNVSRFIAGAAGRRELKG